MASSITTKVIAAIAATLVAELTDKVLDWMGLKEEIGKLPREIIKAAAAAIAALLAEEILSGSNSATLYAIRSDDDNSTPIKDVLVSTARAA